MTRIEKYRRLLARVVKFVKGYQANETPHDNPNLRCPSWRLVARRFRINYGTIEDLISDSDGVLSEVCGIRCGGGIYSYENRGEYEIEYVGD